MHFLQDQAELFISEASYTKSVICNDRILNPPPLAGALLYSITPEISILQSAHATGWRYLVIGCGK